MTGYRRVETVGMGPGAVDIWREVIATAPWDDEPTTVGEVLEVYDRSAYLRISEAYTEDLGMPGPRLILLGGETFDGPLTMRLESPDAGGFDPSGLVAGAPCRLRAIHGGREGEEGYVLSIGPTQEVVFQLPATAEESTEADPTHGVSISRGDSSWRAASATVADLAADGVDDGLDWLPCVERRLQEGEEPQIDCYATAWRELLSNGWSAGPPAAIQELLGRGPGATPSGDDLLSGTLLVLLHVTEGAANDRVREAGATLASLAADRTTSISAALLAQAAHGRAADVVWSAIRSHLGPTTTEQGRRAAVERIVEVGHSSGVDTLLGIVIGILFVAPDATR